MDNLGDWPQWHQILWSSKDTRQSEQREPAAVYSKAALGTVDDVVAFGSGPGTDDLRGVIENTMIFEIIRDHL